MFQYQVSGPHEADQEYECEGKRCLPLLSNSLTDWKAFSCPYALSWGVSQVVLVVKNLPDNAGGVRDEGLTPGLGRSPGGGRGNPLQYSCLENSMDRGAWWVTVHGVARVRHNWSNLVHRTCPCSVSSRASLSLTKEEQVSGLLLY